MGATAPPPERPLVTTHREGQRQVIAAVDRAARLAGLAPGMPLAQATARVPDLMAVAGDPMGDLAALHDLAQFCVRRYSPIAAPDPDDGLWLDVTGCAHLYDGEKGLLDDLATRLARAGITARMAIAETPGAAHALARYGRRKITIVPPGEVVAALEPLPLAGLRLSREVLDGLGRLGFERIGQLLAAPRAPLLRRFGVMLGRRLDQATGRIAEIIEPARPPEMIAARRGFAEPIATPEALSQAITELVGDICRDLEPRGLGARRLDLLCTRVDGSFQAVRIGTARPVRDPHHLTRLLREKLETIDPGFGIEVMVLSVPLAEAFEKIQHAGFGQAENAVPDLAQGNRTKRFRTPSPLMGEGWGGGDASDKPGFHDNYLKAGRSPPPKSSPIKGEDLPIGEQRSFTQLPPDLAPLIDTIANRLGSRRLYRAALVESDLPERMVKKIGPLAPPQRASWPEGIPYPSRLLTPPEPVSVMALLPDQPPVQFIWRRDRHIVCRADGPQRIFGEWWRDDAETWSVRDYFQVEDEAGSRFWLFRAGDADDPKTGDLRWYLHGLFG